MSNVFLAGRIDVAELVFYAFFLFFILLVIHLRRQDRIEGYPKEDENGRIQPSDGPLTMTWPRAFRLPFNRGIATVPRRGLEPLFEGRPYDRFSGAPNVPVGDPMHAGIGPGAYAERLRIPDVDMEGRPRIVPLARDNMFFLSSRDPDPRGMTVIAADGKVAGTVSDVWIDRSDRMIRYLAVATPAGGQVLAPMMMAALDRRRGVIEIDAITAAQYAGAPTAGADGTLTRYDEERIQAYFGGGYLYALPHRAEPLI